MGLARGRQGGGGGSKAALAVRWVPAPVQVTKSGSASEGCPWGYPEQQKALPGMPDRA